MKIKMPPVCKVLISLYLLINIFYFLYASGVMLFYTNPYRGLDLVMPTVFLTLPWSILAFVIGQAYGRIMPDFMWKIFLGIYFGLGILVNCVVIYWFGRIIAIVIPGHEVPVAGNGIPEKKKSPINIFNIIVVLSIVSYILFAIVT